MKKSFSKVLISIYSLIAFQTPQGVLAESDVFEKCNKLDDAIEFRECISSNQSIKKGSTISNFENALKFFESGDTSSSLKAINLYIDANPDSKEAYLVRGIIYGWDLSDVEKSQSDFDKAIEIDDKYSYAYALRADNLYWELGNATQAKKDIEKAIIHSPNNPYVNNVRGHIFLDIGLTFFEKEKFDLAINSAKEAVISFEKVVNNNNDENENLLIKRLFPLGLTYDAHTSLGDTKFDLLYFAHKKNKQRDDAKRSLNEAINHYSNAITLAPTQEEAEKYEIERDFDMLTPAEIHLYRGNAYSWSSSQKDWKKACKDWKISKKLGNKEAQTNYRQWKC
tara:strand:- start:158 stop:1171 length:1014 start_codon:yes stop_codon:yes gene_type:complete